MTRLSKADMSVDEANNLAAMMRAAENPMNTVTDLLRFTDSIINQEANQIVKSSIIESLSWKNFVKTGSNLRTSKLQELTWLDISKWLTEDDLVKAANDAAKDPTITTLFKQIDWEYQYFTKSADKYHINSAWEKLLNIKSDWGLIRIADRTVSDWAQKKFADYIDSITWTEAEKNLKNMTGLNDADIAKLKQEDTYSVMVEQINKFIPCI